MTGPTTSCTASRKGQNSLTQLAEKQNKKTCDSNVSFTKLLFSCRCRLLAVDLKSRVQLCQKKTPIDVQLKLLLASPEQFVSRDSFSGLRSRSEEGEASGPAAWERDRLREASAATAATAKGRLLNHLKLPRRGSVTAASENRTCLTERRQSLGYTPPPTPHPIPCPRSVYISVSCGLNG